MPVGLAVFEMGPSQREALPVAPGTYAFVLRCEEPRRITVGALGEFELRPGWYVYVGSAVGPGGLRARVTRHLAGSSVQRWHVDYLRAHTTPVEVWVGESAERLECVWALALLALGEVTIPGFGSTDCSCVSHLVFFDSGELAEADGLTKIVRARLALDPRGSLKMPERQCCSSSSAEDALASGGPFQSPPPKMLDQSIDP